MHSGGHLDHEYAIKIQLFQFKVSPTPTPLLYHGCSPASILTFSKQRFSFGVQLQFSSGDFFICLRQEKAVSCAMVTHKAGKHLIFDIEPIVTGLPIEWNAVRRLHDMP